MELVRINMNNNGVWMCELNRPEKLNALSSSLVKELTEFFVEAQLAALKMECRVLVIKSSSPKAFCVGADLSERKGMNEEQVLAALDGLRQLTVALENVPCPTLAVIEGAAFGGGLELALCCDARVASETASLGLTETRLAIIPGAGGTQRLARLVGLSQAKELIFCGKRVSGREALDLGLVNATTNDVAKWEQNYCAQILEGGPVALLAAKEAIEQGYGLSLSEGLDVERAAYQKTLQTQDRIEGLLAFSEKRKPQYQGK